MGRSTWDGVTPKMCWIYALVDPRTDEVRYVGLSATSISDRLYAHLNHAAKTTRTKKCAWIRQLQKLALQPELRIVEEREMTSAELCEREIYWIAEYKSQGHRLTNLTAGGEGVLGFSAPRTPEWNAKVAAAVKAAEARMTPEQKAAREHKRQQTMFDRYGTLSTQQFIDPANMGKAHRGKKHPPELIEKMREGQRRKWERIRAEGRYEETCRNIAAGTRAANDKAGSGTS